MRTRLRHGLSAAAFSVLCTLLGAFPSFAANITGGVDSVTDTQINGWAIDADNPDKNAEVALYVYTDGSTKAEQLATVTADQYRSDLEKNAGNGAHGFTYDVNWEKLNGSTFVVQAYAVSDSSQTLLGTSPQYTKKGAAFADTAKGPAGASSEVQGTSKADAASSEAGTESGVRGEYLGSFITTAYCNCTQCSNGHNLTYSGTVPKANHTISADIDYYPIGTKLMIGNTVYTVEDIGTGVDGHTLDIFFNTHEQALNYGRKTVDVYSVK